MKTNRSEFQKLMASRTRPLMSGLELCAEQLERLNSTDPDVLFALDWAKKAIAWNNEMTGQE